MSLSILVVTAGEPYARPFLDELERLAVSLDAELVEHHAPGAGAIEYVLADALERCTRDYVLRIDDDERCSDDMTAWLAAGVYRAAEVWSFPRAHLYPDAESFVTSPPLWPDLQTRLTVRAKAGGRRRLHEGSPYGAGTVARVVLEHHKFLVRSLDERQALLERYEALQPGAGRGWAIFSVPEAFELAIDPYPIPVAA